jgi:hypothetical protein
MREIKKKSEYGKQIYESRKNYSYIKDEIVIDLVQSHIEECERNQKGTRKEEDRLDFRRIPENTSLSFGSSTYENHS